MVDTVGLNTHLYVIGTNVDPVAYYYADSTKTLTVSLYDINGSQIGQSTSYNLNAGLNTLYLGDYLNGLNLSEGFYVLKIGDYNFTIIASNGGTSTPTDPDGVVERIIVMHKKTGLMAEMPKTAPSIPYSDSFMTAVYMHNNQKKHGRVFFYDGLNEYDTGWARKAILELQVSFPDYDTMYQYIISHLNDIGSDSMSALGKIANNSITDGVKTVGLYGIVPLLGTIIDYNIDVQNKKMAIRVVERLGYGFDGLKKALYVIGGGALALAGIGAGIAVSTATAGAGSALGVAIAGAGIAAGLYVIHKAVSEDSASEESWLSKLDYQYRQGISDITEKKDDALSVLDYYHDNGEISDQAYNDLKQRIIDLYNTSITVVKEIYETSKSCYDAGRKSVENKKWRYATIGIIGGAIFDRLLGRVK